MPLPWHPRESTDEPQPWRYIESRPAATSVGLRINEGYELDEEPPPSWQPEFSIAAQAATAADVDQYSSNSSEITPRVAEEPPEYPAESLEVRTAVINGKAMLSDGQEGQSDQSDSIPHAANGRQPEVLASLDHSPMISSVQEVPSIQEQTRPERSPSVPFEGESLSKQNEMFNEDLEEDEKLPTYKEALSEEEERI